ncbi:mandelate racemase/muconate lactonizing enzyme family protein [Pelagicoccus mobilis]|uniref:Mandelate racemase/muconate lactonizing enzyme family protein n=1 Tax=Pelagicoccus mobilis TaxID=415221 RepID=A0A934VSI3_9BACT|nr:mandelate racemase/muconate lactonizing enzyme family protein [Pelagicoccus mobilis]MBK1878539.1 mandelate racemase/muconate lactonizing enzyme family protein [Pelagicoccus mobilis]
MQITKIKTYPTRIGNSAQLLVKVETSKGTYGWGASGLTSREHAVIGAIRHFENFLIGQDPRRIGAIWQELYRGQYFEGGRVLTAAISAIDIALHDIKAKSLNIPVYELLGGRQRDFVDCFASIKFRDAEQAIERCKTTLDAGWNALRLTHFDDQATGDDALTFEPRESVDHIANCFTTLREAIGSRPVVGFDYHHRLSIPETVSFLQRMPEGTLDFLEEPIRDENPEAYKTLRSMTTVPFAIGEEFASKWQFRPFIEEGLTQFARIDVCNLGGLTESMKVAAMAETHYIDLMPHNPLGPICTAASIHLAAASPNFAYLEEIHTPVDNPGLCDERFYPVQPELEGARYPVSETPGLGVEVDEAEVEKAEFSLLEVPHFRRKDGSFTNW